MRTSAGVVQLSGSGDGYSVAISLPWQLFRARPGTMPCRSNGAASHSIATVGSRLCCGVYGVVDAERGEGKEKGDPMSASGPTINIYKYNDMII